MTEGQRARYDALCAGFLALAAEIDPKTRVWEISITIKSGVIVRSFFTRELLSDSENPEGFLEANKCQK